MRLFSCSASDTCPWFGQMFGLIKMGMENLIPCHTVLFNYLCLRHWLASKQTEENPITVFNKNQIKLWYILTY